MKTTERMKHHSIRAAIFSGLLLPIVAILGSIQRTHDELLAQKGHYYKLYTTQFVNEATDELLHA